MRQDNNSMLRENVKDETEVRLDVIRGCIYGGAVGDALGYPVEFMTEESEL